MLALGVQPFGPAGPRALALLQFPDGRSIGLGICGDCTRKHRGWRPLMETLGARFSELGLGPGKLVKIGRLQTRPGPLPRGIFSDSDG
jgi:hypothetical protein